VWLLYGEGREIGREGGREERKGGTNCISAEGRRARLSHFLCGGWVGGWCDKIY